MPKPIKVFVFKDATSLTRWVKWLLYVGVVLSAVSMVSSIMEYQLLNTMQSGAFESRTQVVEAAAKSDLRQQSIGVVQIALLSVTCIAVLMWIYRANNNAHALSSDSMRCWTHLAKHLSTSMPARPPTKRTSPGGADLR